MPSPAPTLPTFVDGQDFDTEAKLRILNLAISRIKDKFGALVAHDMAGSTLDPQGPIDARSNLFSNVSEAGRWINYEQDGRSLDTILNDATEPVTVYIPRNVTAEVTAPAILRDDFQVVGQGFGSNVRCSTEGVRAIFECTGGTGWALRNVRVDGGRDAATALIHMGLYISGVQDVECLVENVAFGMAQMGGSHTNGLPSWAVYISDASEIKVVGCNLRACSNGGVFMKDSSHIDIHETKVQRNEGPGISIEDCQWVRIGECRVQWNDETNIRLVAGTFISIAGNEVHNPGTDGFQAGTPGSFSNLFVAGTTSISIVDNHLLDTTMGTEFASTFGQLTAAYQVEGLSSPQPVSRMVLVGNHMNETSQTPTTGQVTSLNGLLLTQNYSRDQNHIFGNGGYEQLRRGWGGWNPQDSRQTNDEFAAFDMPLQWNYWQAETTTAPKEHCVNYAPTFVNLSRHGARGRNGVTYGDGIQDVYGPMIWPLGGPGPFYGAVQAQHSWFTWDGSPGHAFRIGMQAFVETLCNMGGLLSPMVIGTGVTNLANEVGAVQATFNIYERMAGEIPEHPSGILEVENALGTLDQGVEPARTWAPFWGDTGAFTWDWAGRGANTGAAVTAPLSGGAGIQGRVEMGDNVLCSYITSVSPYPRWSGVTAGDLNRGPGFIVVWSAQTNTHRDQRPTWVVTHQ